MASPLPPFESYFFGSNLLTGQFWWTSVATIAPLPSDFPSKLRNHPRSFVAEWQGLRDQSVKQVLGGEYAYQQFEGWTVVGMWDTGGGSLVEQSCLVFAIRGLLPEDTALKLISQVYGGGAAGPPPPP